MEVLIFMSSPNEDGLTAACARAAQEGVELGGGQGELVMLNIQSVGMCQACENGWGTCREEHTCQVEDGFQPLHERVRRADGYIFVTPVYWGDLSESVRAFLDRLRRCEALRGEESCFTGKPVLGVAAAGGSGNGTLSCLTSLERWAQHVKARPFDLLPVRRWSRVYMLNTIRNAAGQMVREYTG